MSSSHDASDDEANFSLSSTPTPGPSAVHSHRPMIGRSTSRNSAWSETPGAAHAHQQQGTGYFPPSSPNFNRPSSPPLRRLNTGSRYGRVASVSGRPHRSTSVSTAERGLMEDDDEETGGADGDGDVGGDDTAGVDAGEAEEREFTEEDPLTLKDRQSLINVEHPFGLPIWKPALYKKSRTVTREAETEVHSVPKAVTERHFMPGNVFWALCFGWWLAVVILVVAGLVWFVERRYGNLLFGLAWYIVWPFGKYVEGENEDETEDKQPGDDEEADGEVERLPSDESAGTVRGTSPILEANESDSSSSRVPLTSHSSISTVTPNKLHNKHQSLPSWNSDLAHERTLLLSSTRPKSYGTTPPSSTSSQVASFLSKAIFYLALISIIAPLLLIVTLICWGLVITIPMAKLNWELLTHLFMRPLRIHFRSAPPSTPVIPVPPGHLPEGSIATTGSNHDPILIQQTQEQRGSHAQTASQGTARLTAGQVAPHSPDGPHPHPHPSTVLLCTYRAVGLRYYKYTVGGVNILFINLLPVVFFVIFDGMVLLPIAEHHEKMGQPLTGVFGFITSRTLIFVMSLLSVIPLSYFIGMAVASISAQSSIGMGAVINATFGSIIEIILYGIALTDGKGLLVEGSIVGSLLAGVLLMPGLSMCGGAVRQKEQKFNAKSAGVTSTMLIMAIIGVLTPTMFYQTYGNFQLTCDGCPSAPPVTSPTNTSLLFSSLEPNATGLPWTCTHCYYEHPDPTTDPFYQNTVKEFMYFCAGVLLLSYLIGLWFSLRTHASQIWQNPQQLMHPLDLGPVNVPGASGRMSLYHRLAQANLTGGLPSHQNQGRQGTQGHWQGLTNRLARKASQLTTSGNWGPGNKDRGSGSGEPPLSPTSGNMSMSVGSLGSVPGTGTGGGTLSAASATSSALPQQQTQQRPLSPSPSRPTHISIVNPPIPYTPLLESVDQAVKSQGLTAQPLPPNFTTDDFTRAVAVATVSALRHQGVGGAAVSPVRMRGSGPVGGMGGAEHDGGTGGGHGGHEAPSWSRMFSASVLLGCTFLYAIIAELLVEVVDVVLEGSGISEKFLGITLFALVPNTTEFMNAISFALNGNIALSMEIGSAYALQVCLLQIPAMVAFSAWYQGGGDDNMASTFTLIFPRWDVITIILSIFLLTYTYIEAKANYHRGSILILSYVVLGAGFYYAPPLTEVQQYTRPFVFGFVQGANPSVPNGDILKSLGSWLGVR